MALTPHRAAALLTTALLALTAPQASAQAPTEPPIQTPTRGDAPVGEAEIRADVAILSSDAFGGRAPGTTGEARTIAHIVAALTKAGFEPGVPVGATASGPGAARDWLQPVPLYTATPRSASLSLRRGGLVTTISPDELVLSSDVETTRIADAPVVFVGYGAADPATARDVLAGAVVVMLGDQPPAGVRVPGVRQRSAALTAAGARAVLITQPAGTPWAELSRPQSPRIRPGGTAPTGAVTGLLSTQALARMTGAARQGDGAKLIAMAADPAFRPVTLPVTASLDVAVDIRRFDSHNVIGRLPGARPDGKAVLLMGHWDHLGQCRPEGAPDRICNGAVDNASGIAALLAVARRLGAGPRPDRDIYIMGTTAEESGLLGAYHFAADPVVPLDDITVALNIDTIAIAPRGAPVAIVGQGDAPYDAVVHAAARQLGRAIDMDGEADAFIQRQDGWALKAQRVPTLMAGGSFADMKPLEAYLAGPYHAPDDQLTDTLPLGGAAEDADLHVLMARAFASRDRWTHRGRAPEPAPAAQSAPVARP